MQFVKSVAPSVAGFLFLLAIWIVIYQAKVLPPVVLPSPLEVIDAFGLWINTSFASDLFFTVLRLSLSIGIGTLLGLLVGILIATILSLGRVAMPLIDSLRSIPAIALFPLFAVVFGIGEYARIASATFSVIFLVALHTSQGIVTVNKILLLFPQTIVLPSARASQWVLNEIVLHAALPVILFGLRLSLPLTLVVVVATEMFFGTPQGLGSRIITSQLAYRIPLAWAAIITTGALGYALNLLITWIEGKYNFWVGK